MGATSPPSIAVILQCPQRVFTYVLHPIQKAGQHFLQISVYSALNEKGHKNRRHCLGLQAPSPILTGIPITPVYTLRLHLDQAKAGRNTTLTKDVSMVHKTTLPVTGLSRYDRDAA